MNTREEHIQKVLGTLYTYEIEIYVYAHFYKLHIPTKLRTFYSIIVYDAPTQDWAIRQAKLKAMSKFNSLNPFIIGKVTAEITYIKQDPELTYNYI